MPFCAGTHQHDPALSSQLPKWQVLGPPRLTFTQPHQQLGAICKFLEVNSLKALVFTSKLIVHGAALNDLYGVCVGGGVADGATAPGRQGQSRNAGGLRALHADVHGLGGHCWAGQYSRHTRCVLCRLPHVPWHHTPWCPHQVSCCMMPLCQPGTICAHPCPALLTL